MNSKKPSITNTEVQPWINALFEGISIRNKILIGFSLPIFLMMIVIITIYSNTKTLFESNRWVDHSYEVIAQTRLLDHSLNDMERDLHKYLMSGDKTNLQSFSKAHDSWKTDIQYLGSLLLNNPIYYREINSIRRLTAEWIQNSVKPAITLRQSLKEQDISILYLKNSLYETNGEESVGNIRTLINRLISKEDALIRVSAQDADSQSDDILVHAILGAIFSLILAIATAVAFSQTILSRLSMLLTATNDVASGDFSTDIQVEGNDEFDDLAKSFNRMTNKLQESTQIAEESRNELKAHAKVLQQKNKNIENNNQQLISAHEQLAEQAEDLVKSSKIKSEFLASMSHEIRTPMNGVLGMLGLLRKEDLNSGQQRKVEIAHSSAQSLLTVINDILDFSKIEANKIELELLDFDLPSQLGDIAEALALKAHEKGLEFILDIRGVQRGAVKGDPGRIRQILNNLVGNAIKFTLTGEIILKIDLIEDSKDKDLELRCSVIDSGVGISDDKIDHIFDSFTQEDATTTRKFGGTGLGLSIARQLTVLMGGDIRVESALGKGSIFTFSIKLEPSDEIQCIPSVNISDQDILIVDDNVTLREVFKGQLELWGARVTTAGSAEHALMALLSRDNNNLFDIVFIDSIMPETSGLDLGDSIRKNPRYDAVKLVIMTDMQSQHNAQKYEDFGFNGYFPKPITFGNLFNALSILFENDRSFDDTSSQSSFPKNRAHGTHINSSSELKLHFDSSTRLLIVEDNAINQEVIRCLLDDYDVNCSFAGNGNEALQALRHAPKNLPFSFVFMDCQMPEMDGFTATGLIRKGNAGQENKSITIVAMTANAMRGDKERCLDAGMNDYLSKPIQENKLIDMLNKHLAPSDQTNFENEIMTNHDPIPSSNDTPAVSEHKTWDEEDFLERVRGRTDRALKLMDSFEKSVSIDTASLKQAIAQHDDNAVVELSHKIKGIAGNLSAIQLAKNMSAIEDACETQNIEKLSTLSDEIDTLLSELSVQFDEARERFSR